MSDLAVPEKPSLESLARQVQSLQERLEELEDLMELRAAVDRNEGKPGVAWDEAKRELGLD